MKSSTLITVNELPIHEKSLFSVLFSGNNFVSIEMCSSILYKGIQINTHNNKYKCQNFTVSYWKASKNLNSGFIVKLYKINNYFYAVIQKLKKSKSFIDNSTLEERLNDFFLICELENDFKIILLEIIKKCVLIVNNNEYFFSVCNELNEHD